MSYQVLALKYRPQTFKEVIGQSHVTTTLANAISSDRVAHAILFAGPRGTGKTSIARILAKAMNCALGPAPDPCNKCKSCTGITTGNSVDVFEIDGASNNSVDQVRELRENVTYLPSMSRFKIYIIDEVHMLTTAAFNALLKTLEEPPAHVLFIFATTEPHKIPVTILSRCQRHDLGRISLSEIADYLKDICIKEGYTIPTESIDIIASEADGSMRDSLSLLDRIISGTEKKEIDHETILQNLGIIDKQITFDLSKAIIDSNGALILELINKVHGLGLNLQKFYSGIIRHFRDLAVIKICKKNTNFMDISDSDRKIMGHTVSFVSQGYLTEILNILIQEESMIKFASHTKIALEMVLLKLLEIRKGIDINDIVEKLDFLVKNNTNMKNPNTDEQIALESSALPAMDISVQKKTGKKPRESQPVRNKPAADPPFKKRSLKKQNKIKISGQVRTEKKDWEKFVREVRKTLPFVASALSKGRLKNITKTDIIFEASAKPGDALRIESKIKELKEISSVFFGKELSIKIIRPSTPDGGKAEKNPAQIRNEILSHPLVAEALKIFNGNVVQIN